MGWRDLSKERRDALYQRKQSGEPIVVLAEEVGANPETLSRQLRRHGQEMRGDISPTVGDDTKVSINDNGNYREIVAVGPRISTLEQLLDYCNVNEDEWIIDRHEINKWEAARKDVRRDLSFDAGKVDGFIEDTGGFHVEPLFQVKATMVRRRPQPITPVIQPVNINLNHKKVEPRVRGMKAALIVPDPQFGFARNIHNNRLVPFHDRRALDAVRQIAADVEPDVVVFLGDIVDMSAWSDKFIRMPEFYFTTQPSLIEASWYISQIKGYAAEDAVAMLGNHDIRMRTQIVKHLTEAYQLRSADQLEAGPVMGMDNLLGLSRMGVKFVEDYPDGEWWLNNTTKIIHGIKVRAGSGATAAAVVRDANETVIFGHIHREEMASKTIRSRNGLRTVTAYSPGCLCHIDGRVPGSTKDSQWQQGAAIVWFDEERSSITPINIHDGRAVYNGSLYEGKDYVDELERDTDWDF